ncbi:MAG: AAA-like domain-containing protein [Limisphaerales bacterium]
MSNITTAPVAAILFKRGLEPDETLAAELERHLAEAGVKAALDRSPSTGEAWARETESHLRTAQVVVPLLSSESVHGEMFQGQVEIAHNFAQEQAGRPGLVPVRVAWEGELPEPLAGLMDEPQVIRWHSPADTAAVAAEIVRRTRPGLRVQQREGPPHRPAVIRFGPRPTADLDPPPYPPEHPGGAVPLHSHFYARRAMDGELEKALRERVSTVLIKGARQVGKTSLLARGLQSARESGCKVALMDYQKLNAHELENVQHFFMGLAESLAAQLDIDVDVRAFWDPERGANTNFERLLRREILRRLNTHLVWAMDEVDRLFTCPFRNEVFALFRSWHNERATDPSGPWAGLTLAITYATEAHLLIDDPNMSPFNIGVRIELSDFTEEHVRELNRRHLGTPLKDDADLRRLLGLLGGHPFLIRRALYELAMGRLTLDALEATADRDDGIFGEHLRRLLVMLAREPGLQLMDVVRGVLRGQPCPTDESFFRLRSAGVMTGSVRADVRPRCELYRRFLARHLL